MTAATKDRVVDRQPAELVTYQGSSNYQIFSGTGVMAKDGDIQPVAQGAGISSASNIFLGIAENNAIGFDGSNGNSTANVDVWAEGEFTLEVNGTGASSDIGKKVYFVDDQTVGVSVAPPRILAGNVTGLRTTSLYRVRINSAVGENVEVS